MTLDPKNYQKALKVTYGRAPQEHIESMLAAGHQYDPDHAQADNLHDQALADYLEESDDPRALLLKRDFTYRRHPDEPETLYFTDKYRQHRRQLTGDGGIGRRFGGYNTPYGRLEHRIISGPGGEAHDFSMLIPYTAPQGNHTNATLQGLFSPEEAHDLLNRFEVPEQERLK